MEAKTRTSIRVAVQNDAGAVVKDGRVILDSTSDQYYPAFTDDMEETVDPTSITFALRDDGKATSVPNLTEAMTKYVVDCANGLRPSRIIPAMKTLGENLRPSANLAKSLPDVQNMVSRCFDRAQSRQQLLIYFYAVIYRKVTCLTSYPGSTRVVLTNRDVIQPSSKISATAQTGPVKATTFEQLPPRGSMVSSFFSPRLYLSSISFVCGGG